MGFRSRRYQTAESFGHITVARGIESVLCQWSFQLLCRDLQWSSSILSLGLGYRHKTQFIHPSIQTRGPRPLVQLVTKRRVLEELTGNGSCSRKVYFGTS